MSQYDKNGNYLNKSEHHRKCSNAFIIIDAKGKMEWANEGFERLHEISFKEFTEKYGDNIFEIKTIKDFTREARRVFRQKSHQPLKPGLTYQTEEMVRLFSHLS
jgi:hypothetical protein